MNYGYICDRSAKQFVNSVEQLKNILSLFSEQIYLSYEYDQYSEVQLIYLLKTAVESRVEEITIFLLVDSMHYIDIISLLEDTFRANGISLVKIKLVFFSNSDISLLYNQGYVLIENAIFFSQFYVTSGLNEEVNEIFTNFQSVFEDFDANIMFYSSYFKIFKLLIETWKEYDGKSMATIKNEMYNRNLLKNNIILDEDVFISRIVRNSLIFVQSISPDYLYRNSIYFGQNLDYICDLSNKSNSIVTKISIILLMYLSGENKIFEVNTIHIILNIFNEINSHVNRVLNCRTHYGTQISYHT